jgi:hypothetical protein
MKLQQAFIRISMAALLFAGLSSTAFSQKLPAIQETSIWAPANAKADARLNEWNDTFQAYNKTTTVYYTVANDDKNLYLVIKSTDQTNNNKIIGGGINFTINTDGKKKEKDAFTIMYPVVNIANLRNQMMRRMGGNNGQPLDSAAIAGMRKQAISMAKEIKLIGFKDVPDSLVSIYNEYGIKAAIDYDTKGALTYEMAIPLKYMHLSGGASFAYNLKLNGINIESLIPGGRNMFGGNPGGGGGDFAGRQGGGGGAGGGQAFVMTNGGGPGMGGMPGMADIQAMLSATDFWGKYTLAKK